MSQLVSFATCKRCNAQIEIPPLPVIVAETQPEKAGRMAALQAGTIVKHFVTAHGDSRNHSLAWAGLFTEFYFLSMFDLKDSQVLQDHYDAQRLLLLRLCQREFIVGPAELHSEAAANVMEYYEETKRVKELEAAGYTITRGFLGQPDKSKVVL